MSYVYLIRHAIEPRFKIGKARHPLVRSKSFSGEKLDLGGSLRIRLGKRADGIEKGLQALFDAYRLPPVGKYEGATEWFRMECWNLCIAFFEHHRALIDTIPEAIPIPNKDGVDEKIERRRKRIEAQQKRLQKNNLQSIENWERFLRWIDAHEIAETCIDSDGNLNIGLFRVSDASIQQFVKQRVGSCFLESNRNLFPCGVYSARWGGADGAFDLLFHRVPAGAWDEIKADIDSKLYDRFQAVDAWIEQRIAEVSIRRATQ